MTQADDRLKALFAHDDPPGRDPLFEMAVMEALVRQRFQEDVAVLCGVSILGGGVLWLIWPALASALAAVSLGVSPALGAMALAICAMMILGGRPAAALGLGS
jgi:hypothetical protein